MSTVQSLLERSDTSYSREMDSRLPPNPAYLRRRGHDSETAEHSPSHLEMRYSGGALDTGPIMHGDDVRESEVSYPTHSPSPPYVSQTNSSSPSPHPSSQFDNYTELAEQFNNISLNKSSMSSSDVHDRNRNGEDFAYPDNLTSSHSRNYRSENEIHLYNNKNSAESSSADHFNLEDRRIWPEDGYEHSLPSQSRSFHGGQDPFVAAASNVLGGPPNDELANYVGNSSSQHGIPGLQGFASSGESYEEFPAPQLTSHAQGSEEEQFVHQTPSFPEDSTFSTYAQDLSDDGSRSSLHRSGTTSSVSLGTRKMKAVDLRSPPYTKEFIEDYRQRIRNDPDPEAHFQYARYLIDAARNIGANAADQRAVRKYRELLVQEALKVVRRLATQGEPYAEAQFFLANCHGTGMLSLQVDHERAYHLYLQAAKQNHSAAAYRVAVCNEIGAGTRRELPRAFAFYRKSASLGDTAAMYKLGMVLLSGGLGQQSNPREAVAWLRRAAEQADEDNPHALHELGLLHENPESKIVPYDPLYAKNLFTKAAQLGYTQSQFKLGQCYEYGTLTCTVDPRRSIGWYTRAAEKGNAEAELALSGWYLTGSDGVLKQSDSEAYLWARRAANKGLSTAEYAVGYFSEIGIGVKQDIELAKRWYMRSAAQGNKRAMNRLTELKRMGNKRGAAVRPTRQQAKEECVIC